MKVKIWILATFILLGCAENPSQKPSTSNQPSSPQPNEVKTEIKLRQTPQFNAANAYDYIQKQVDFGPRVPNTKTHKACAKYLATTLANLGLDTIVQRTTVTAFNGKPLSIQNIIGQYNASATTRILLCAHWDSRPLQTETQKSKQNRLRVQMMAAVALVFY